MGMMDMLNPMNAPGMKKVTGAVRGAVKKLPGMQQMGNAAQKFAPPGMNKMMGLGPSNQMQQKMMPKNPTGPVGGGFTGGMNLSRPQMNVPPPEYRQAGEAAGNDMSWMDAQAAPPSNMPMQPMPDVPMGGNNLFQKIQMMQAKRNRPQPAPYIGPM